MKPDALTKKSQFYFLFLEIVFICILLMPKSAISGPLNYQFTLINKSDIHITKVILIPYEFIQIHSDTNLSFDDKTTILRPECEKMKIEIVHDKGEFSFPFTKFAHKKDTAWSFSVRSDSVPVLFNEKTKEEITGNNSDWKFKLTLDSFPFSVGSTTMKKAASLGAYAGKNPNEMETTIRWHNRVWNITMLFSDSTADSLLMAIEMSTKGVRSDMPEFIHESLMSHGYVYYETQLKNKEKDLYISIPLARALENARLKGQNPLPILEAYHKEIVIQSFPQKGFWHVLMTLAPNLLRGKPH